MFKAIKFFNRADSRWLKSPYTERSYLINTQYKVIPPIIMCNTGFHFPFSLSGINNWGERYFNPNLVACIIEISGEIKYDGCDKCAVENMCIIEVLDIPRIGNNRRESIRAFLRELRVNHPELIYYSSGHRNRFASIVNAFNRYGAYYSVLPEDNQLEM
jgi:uncharacterized protein YggL (DUF469 family)